MKVRHVALVWPDNSAVRRTSDQQAARAAVESLQPTSLPASDMVSACIRNKTLGQLDCAE